MEVLLPKDIPHKFYNSTITAGIYSINSSTGQYEINENMIPDPIDVAEANYDNEDALFLVEFDTDKYTKDDVFVFTPFGYTDIKIDGDNKIYVVIHQDPFFLASKGYRVW